MPDLIDDDAIFVQPVCIACAVKSEVEVPKSAIRRNIGNSRELPWIARWNVVEKCAFYVC